ncbi:MAG: TlyA family RNA methyltransferase [Hyphomicrobium sp.]|nr:TlyA family RNA methyltransferase [Hyphomicrobium sp.]
MTRRLDEVLVLRGLVPTRSRARDAILRGHVTVDGEILRKAGASVLPHAAIAVADAAGTAYVSRGALKLIAALDAFSFDVSGRTALDAGASTGGFTEVLLARGARHVTAVDVGHGQLHERLRVDPRIAVIEGRDARSLTSADIPEPVGAIVADLSFIGLAKVLPSLLPLAAGRAWLVALVKPQFEVGREGIGKRGIVTDDKHRQSALDNVAECVGATPGWRVTGTIPSPIEGGSGNREFLLGAVHER